MPIDFLSKLNPKTWSIIKMAGFGLLAAFAIVFILNLVSIASGRMSSGSDGFLGLSAQTVSMEGASDSKQYAEDSYAGNAVGLSVRNIAPMPPSEPASPTGTDAEAYEVTDYGVTIETRELARDCGAIAGLKARTDVIFEYANEFDHGCIYSFKVKIDAAEGVLAMLKTMNPKDVNENTRTIKRLIDDYTSETDVLTKKRDSIDATMASAMKAYDEITRVASASNDADALARIINSKIAIIERLTQERMNVDAQLDRLARAKADELDRVDFVFFNVSVTERNFVDGEQLADSWRDAIRQFVRDTNQALQLATIGTITLLLIAFQYALYALLLLLAVKYGWKVGKRIWKA